MRITKALPGSWQCCLAVCHCRNCISEQVRTMHHPNEALGDVLIKMGLSKKKRWVQNSASFYLTVQRGKGLPKRENIKHDMSHLAFGSDTGDPNKLGQSAHPAERLLPSAKEKLFLSLNHTWIHACPLLPHGQDAQG